MIAERAGNQTPTSLDPSGKTLAFASFVGGISDIRMLPLDGDRQPKQFGDTPGKMLGTLCGQAVFSPDGQWVAYMSNELNTSREEIFVQAYPTGAKYQVTTEGDDSPVWSPGGQQLFYRSGTKIFAVDVRTQPAFSHGKPTALPIAGAIQQRFDITPDGKRFLVVLPASQEETNSRPTVQINVVLNWFRELQERVPVN
jgi:Tol biopolymer transport system component